MRSTLILIALASGLAGCSTGMRDQPARGLDAVNVPVVTSSNYVFDVAAPGGSLTPEEGARLDGWFHGLGLGYGDSIYVDGAYADVARSQVAQLAGNYGLMVSGGAPITPGVIVPGSVRVIVTRTRAAMSNCPNWSGESQPTWMNASMPNYGCAVGGNLAAMIANPEDLVHGREDSAVVDALTGAKAVGVYRQSVPTGTKGLIDISTRKGSN